MLADEGAFGYHHCNSFMEPNLALSPDDDPLIDDPSHFNWGLVWDTDSISLSHDRAFLILSIS